jgi:GrpB-like predicted nucleotidyltransferase (UPF0157 family)
MRTKRVIIVPYDPKWNHEFQKTKSYLERALENSILAIEHVKSRLKNIAQLNYKQQ